MKKHIAEELPSRSYAPVAANAGAAKSEKPGEREDQSEEKQIRQAVYDIRYRARRENVPLRVAFSQYMQNSKLGSRARLIVKEKLFGKGGMQSEEFQIENVAYDSLAKAMLKVFVENSNSDEIDIDELTDELEESSHSNQDRKYKVRVVDKNSGNSYVRYATRSKIAQLRANPNIESVEMTEYGEPYEGERKGGEQTAAALSNKDWDKDGKLESPGKEHAGVVHNAIQRKKGLPADGKDTSSVKEDFISEVKKDKNKPIDILPKSKKNLVKVGPDDGSGSRADVMAHYEAEGPFLKESAVSKSQQRFMGMVLQAKRGAKPMSPQVAKAASSMSKSEAEKFASTKHSGLPEHVPSEKEGGCDSDSREMPTKVNLVKNKLRSMGLKMSYEPEGEQIDELNRYAKETGRSLKTGKPTSTGGKYGGSDTSSQALRSVMKSMGDARMGVKPRGKKKVPGQKPPKAGEYGSERRSPEQIIKNRRAAAQRLGDVYKPRVGESD